jgi:hypothetical protein
MRSGSTIKRRKLGLNHFGLVSARSETNSMNVVQMFHEFEIGLESSWRVTSTAWRAHVAPAGGRRFLGVRIKSRKKASVKNPNIVMAPGL